MQYKYSKIDLEQFAVLTDAPIDNNAEIKIRTDLEFAYSRENRLLANKITITATDKDQMLMKAVMSSYFEIAPDSIEEISEDDGRLVFDPMSLVQFASLNYGSLRGALYVKTANTPLKDLVIPPIYFHKIITSAFTIE